MSRCIPFPPPGYVWNGASGEALLMYIKIWREKVAAVKKRKKEEDKRKRKHKNGELEEGEIREERCSHKHKKSKKVGETRDCRLNEEHENETSETSNLTEEHDQLITSDSLYDSSDNTETVKWKIAVTSVVKDLSPMPYRELCGSSAADEQADTAAAFSSSKRRLQDIEAKLGELFANAALPPFQIELPQPDDQGWLSGGKLPRSDTTRVSHDPPGTHYLSQAYIHALPYALLF